MEGRGEKEQDERKPYEGEANLTFLNLINTSLNHPIWRVIVQYARGKWHLSALMLSFSVQITHLLCIDLLNKRRE